MIPDYVSLAYRVTYWHHPREDKLVSNLDKKYTCSTIFTVCNVYTTVNSRFSVVCWHFHTCYTGIFGVHDRVIMGFALNRTACFSFFLILFYQLWWCVLYMLLGLFAIFLSNFGDASYTQAYTVGGLDCCVITTEFRTRVQWIHM